MKKSILKISIIAVIIICACFTYASAYSYKAAITLNSNATIKSGDEIGIRMKVSDLDVGSNGLNSISGFLQYNEEVFEKLTDTSIEGLNGWAVTYNSNNGRLTLTKSAFASSDEEVFQVMLKVKTNSDGKEAEVSYTDIEASNGTDDITTSDTSVRVKVGSTSTNNDSDSDNGNNNSSTTYTDFSKAKYSLVKQGVSNAQVEITGVEPIDGHYYYGYIFKDSTTKPDLTSTSSSGYEVITYDKNTKKMIVPSLDKYVELNQELHLTIVENPGSASDKKAVAEDIKLTRFEEAKNNDGFHATFLSDSSDQIVTTFTHNNNNTRKLTIKIGKITDNNILNKIKNKNSSGMTDLLSYAKSNNGVLTKTVTVSNKSFIEHTVNSASSSDKIVLNNLDNNAYYYLYVVADNENGKYINQEAVTLALYDKKTNGEWYLFFYGANDFKWGDLGNVTDTTTTNKTIPATGESLFSIFALVTLAGISFYLYNKNQKYKGI